MPDFTLEKSIGGTVAGLDEAGRGPWAGPVVAAAVVLEIENLPAVLARDLDDSKRLTPQRRERCFAALPQWAAIGVGSASVEEIDRLNILQATFLAMGRAFDHLVEQTSGLAVSHALIDGNRGPTLPCPVTTVVGGDGLSLSIAAASIVAKVTRDRIMTETATLFPGYGFEHHKGYGTADHRAALARLGVCACHRRSYAPVAALLRERRVET
ncbi:MAG: ribonuclease HII [Alphaproteobacteria bacterium]